MEAILTNDPKIEVSAKLWGSFGINIHVPKEKVSELTMEVILPNDPQMEVSPKFLCY